jgi:phytoene dehydrogenase-like protein
MGNMRGGGVMVPMMVTMTHEVPWGIAIGGSNSLAQAMVKMIEANGGTVKLESKVVKILIENNRATGVELENGDVIRAEKGVISSAGTQQTILDLVGEEYIEENIAEKAKRYHWDEMTLCTPHLALNEPPK